MVEIADEVVIRFIADFEKFKGSVVSATGNIKKFEESVNSADKTSQKLDQGLKAFSWTVFAQGALNASTAAAQLYTSISNLARVQTNVKSALVGIERAEDLYARKTLQLNKEIQKNGFLSEKAILLREELATATEDLKVKEEKLALAQDQVNDTYILFTSNVVNTVFGTIQTLVGLDNVSIKSSSKHYCNEGRRCNNKTINCF